MRIYERERSDYRIVSMLQSAEIELLKEQLENLQKLCLKSSFNESVTSFSYAQLVKPNPAPTLMSALSIKTVLPYYMPGLCTNIKALHKINFDKKMIWSF